MINKNDYNCIFNLSIILLFISLVDTYEYR